MSRPTYETLLDRACERHIARTFAERLPALRGSEPIQFRSKVRVDVAYMKDGLIITLVEIKRREVPFGEYPSMMLSASKYDSLKQAEKALNLPILMLWAFVDDVYAWFRVPLPDHVLTHSTGGRIDRGDLDDVEDVIMVPLRYLTVSAPVALLV